MAERDAAEATMSHQAPERSSIPSGDNTVWADISPLLDAACKGFNSFSFKYSLSNTQISTSVLLARIFFKYLFKLGRRSYYARF